MNSSKIYPFIALIIEFGPLILFLILAWYFPFLFAVEALVISTIIALILSWLVQGRIAIFPLLAGLTIILMGAITIYTNDSSFIIVRDTIFNGTLSIIILQGLRKNKLILKDLFKNTFAITDKGWKIVSINWGVWLLLLATSNQIIGSFYSLNFWIVFKTFSFGFSIFFCFYQFLIAHKEKLPNGNILGLRKKAI